eukprot:13662517-Alexandrium_andersonii.AAC.1
MPCPALSWTWACQTRPDQARPNPDRPDQTRPERTGPGQVGPDQTIPSHKLWFTYVYEDSYRDRRIRGAL